MAVVFGPVHSRRFGISLGVDLSPSGKQCNFDCVYCELCAAKPMGAMHDVASASEIVAEIAHVLESGIACDVLTFTANGEPTLYPHLAELVASVRALLARFSAPPKLLILSNGSRFGDANVREALQGFDIVKFSLDAASERVFSRVDRAARGITIGAIIEGIATFAGTFAGELIAEVLLVKGYNDNPDEVARIADALRKIAPARVDVGTIDRPSAYKVSAVNADDIEALLPLFWGLRVFVPRREALCCPQGYDSAQILATLRRRPLSAGDIAALFDNPSQQKLQTLVQNGEIVCEEAGGIVFYRAR